MPEHSRVLRILFVFCCVCGYVWMYLNTWKCSFQCVSSVLWDIIITCIAPDLSVSCTHCIVLLISAPRWLSLLERTHINTVLKEQRLVICFHLCVWCWCEESAPASVCWQQTLSVKVSSHLAHFKGMFWAQCTLSCYNCICDLMYKNKQGWLVYPHEKML